MSPQLVGEAIARRAGAAHVLNEHTPLTAGRRAAAAAPAPAALTRLVAPRVDRVIAVSERAGRAAGPARLPPRADRGRCPTGCSRPTSRCTPSRDATRRELGLDERRLRGAVRGQPAPREGRRGVRRGGRARPASRCRGCAGCSPATGPQRDALERAGREREGVRLLGSRGDVPDLLAACDALCLLERGRGAADQHPRGDGARPAGGDHRRRRHRRGGGPRRDRARRAPRDTGAARGRAGAAGGAAGVGARAGRARPRAPARALRAARRWSTATSARSPRWRPVVASDAADRRPAALARHHARLARGRRACSSTSCARRACTRRRVGPDRRERTAAARLPGHRPGRGGRRAARAARRALDRHSPARARDLARRPRRCWPTRAGLPYAVRLDAPAAPEPPGPAERRRCTRSSGARSAVPGWCCPGARRRERRCRAGARPGGGRAAAGRAPRASCPGGATALAVAYTPDVKAKGLDIVCGAWAAAGLRDARLEVFGVEREAALGPPAPHGDAGARRASSSAARRRREQFRAALRRGRVYVGGARWEDFGHGAARGAGRRRAGGDRAVGRPFEALGAGARAGARSWWHDAVDAGRRWPRRCAPPSSCRRTRARAPTASAPRRCWSPSARRRSQRTVAGEVVPGAAAASSRRCATALSTARSNASASASSGWRSVTARLPAARRSRSAESRTSRPRAAVIAAAVGRVDQQRRSRRRPPRRRPRPRAPSRSAAARPRRASRTVTPNGS